MSFPKVELAKQSVTPSPITCCSLYNYSAGNKAGNLLTETQQSDKERLALGPLLSLPGQIFTMLLVTLTHQFNKSANHTRLAFCHFSCPFTPIIIDILGCSLTNWTIFFCKFATLYLVIYPTESWYRSLHKSLSDWYIKIYVGMTLIYLCLCVSTSHISALSSCFKPLLSWFKTLITVQILGGFSGLCFLFQSLHLKIIWQTKSQLLKTY